MQTCGEVILNDKKERIYTLQNQKGREDESCHVLPTDWIDSGKGLETGNWEEKL